MERKGKSGWETWKGLAPFWGAGMAALFLATGFRLVGFLEAARGVALFHGILLFLFFGAFLPRRAGGKDGNHAESFMAFGLETAFFLYGLGTVPEFLDGGLLLLQKGSHDPYFPVWVWGGLALRLGAVALGFSFSKSQKGSLAWAPWEGAGGKSGSKGKWEPPLVKAPPPGLRKPPLPLVEAVERVTWGLAGPLGDLEDVLEDLLQGEGISGKARERLERARAEARWCWKQVENLGRLIPNEISMEGVFLSEEGRGRSCGEEREERGKETLPPKGSLFLVHLAGKDPSSSREDASEKKEETREEEAIQDPPP